MVKEILVPDIGGAENVDVIDIAVKPGDHVLAEDTLITLESDKATMDIPAPEAGVVKTISIKVGDKVSEGSLILSLEIAAGVKTVSAEKSLQQVVAQEEKTVGVVPTSLGNDIEAVAVKSLVNSEAVNSSKVDVHAGPATRRLANQLGVDLSKVTGSGDKGRILPEDIQAFVKSVMQCSSTANGLSIASAPAIDFAKFGAIEVVPLSRIKKLTGINMHRNWVTVPHVTQFDEADITEMEAFRLASKQEVEQKGGKLTPVVFLLKAVVSALRAYPNFNAALDATGENLIKKKYYHVGVAVDTPNGLVVPVIRHVEQKNFTDLAIELGAISKKAREGKLLPNDMQGGCFTISSLGGIGGTAFTPIINVPEVAILGVSRSEIKPKFIAGEFKPRLILPLSLSYDHRVIDGADGARFSSHLVNVLTDLRRLLL